MKKSHKSILYRLRCACSTLGNKLDGTATHPHKFVYRQRAHKSVVKIIDGLLGDDPENDQRSFDLEELEIHLKYLEDLASADFSDRNGPGLLTELKMP